MGLKQVFDNQTVKHMDALRKQIQSLADFVLNHCFWTYAMLRNFKGKNYTAGMNLGRLCMKLYLKGGPCSDYEDDALNLKQAKS